MSEFIKGFKCNISELGDEVVNRVKKFAKEVINETHNTFENTNTSHRIEKIYTGKLAEEVFKKYMKDSYNITLDINYEIYPGTSNVDEFDFNINGKSIDIKSSKDTKKEGLSNCFNYFNFPVLASQSLKDVTISILYDFEIKNFIIVSWIDKETYTKNCNISSLHVGRGIYKNYRLYKLKFGKNIDQLNDYLFDVEKTSSK